MRTVLVLILIAFIAIIFPKAAQAEVTGCSVNVSPTTTTRDTSTVYSFDGSVDNSESGEGIMWVRFTRPSSNFTITNGIASGWSSSTDGNQITFTAPAQTFFDTFQVYATSGSNDAPSADWAVRMSHDGSGSPAANCSGDLGVSISGSSSVTPTPTATPTPIPDTTAPSISNVSVSSVSDNSVTVSWQTNEDATTQISYGTSSSYTLSKSNSGVRTSHSLTLTSLSVNTTYHAQIRSADNFGNTATSSDFTFATSQATTTVTVSTTVTTLVTPTPTPTPVPDKTPPKITVSTNLNNLFKAAPKIEGTATDTAGVAKVEYSIDDGKNWADADQVTTPGEKKVSFVFTPLTQGDGNYQLKVRATDINENAAESDTQTFIIDRLPPAIGGALFSVGPQILQPSPNGALVTVKGLTPKLTFAAVGGPTSINIQFNGQSIPLSQNGHTRLWSGTLPMTENGTYTLETDSVDGAQNHTHSSLSYLNVLANGVISDILGPISEAELTVYYFDSEAQTFRIWRAEQYGQQNPQITDVLGRYMLLLPAGTYYIHIQAPRSKPLRTNIFTLTQSTPIVQDFMLTKKTSYGYGMLQIPFPDFGQNDAIMNIPEKETVEVSSHSLVGKPFPEFNFDGVTNNFLTGSPMVVSVLTTWLPQSSAQIEVLEQVVKEKNAKSLVIMSQESEASVNVFAKRGGYSLQIIADPDGELVTPLQVRTLPTHYFLNRNGVVTKVVSGVLDKKTIENNLKIEN